MPKSKEPKKVWLVENCGNAPGRIMAVFDDEENAIWFANQLDESMVVEPRTLYYGQPPNRGYNQ